MSAFRTFLQSCHLQVFVDGVQRIESRQALFADADYKLGLSFGEDSQGYFDNFHVTTYDPLDAPQLSIQYGQDTATALFQWSPVAGAASYLLYQGGTPAPVSGLMLLGDTLSWSSGVLPLDAVRRYRVRALAP